MRWLAGLGALALLLVVGVATCGGGDLPVGEIDGDARHPALEARRDALQADAVAGVGEGGGESQILFGDLHVHTQFSIDAYLYALPIYSTRDGGHPPADACDYARHCSALDFFSLNDHAEGLTPERWRATVESLRDCDARSGDPDDPDVVPFLGWEWTQVGTTPETHWGHKNVVLRGLGDDEITARPIAYRPPEDMDRAPNALALRTGEALAALAGRPYADFLWWLGRLLDVPACPEGTPSPALPDDCLESATEPAALFRKLDEWGVDSIVIPHGLAWGIHAPPGARLDPQLAPGQHDEARQTLLEVFSGHGNSEEWRDGVLRERAGADDEVCPAPTPDFLPCCWQAGELMRARCGDLPADACEAKVEAARRSALAAGTKPHGVIPDASVAEWLDCDQCRDCFKPAHTLRPGMSAQYALALERAREANDPIDTPERFRFGFIASSDNHSARAGTGFKQVRRLESTDARGLADTPLVRRIAGIDAPPLPVDELPVQVVPNPRSFDALFDTERTSSFLYPGGLVAVHADGRDRDAIWRAFERREVYGTSGPRILLWFDLLGEDDARTPMGSVVTRTDAPLFEVKAVGAHEQLPGCPDRAGAGMSREALDALCYGECDHPGDVRVPIEAIEIVRVRPQQASGERLGDRIEDPWRRFECSPDPAGCRVEFDDPEFATGGRDTLYYARALQEPTPAINGDLMRTEFDADGNATAVSPCYGDWRVPMDDDCLGEARERAWSSPIFVDVDRGAALQVASEAGARAGALE